MKYYTKISLAIVVSIYLPFFSSCGAQDDVVEGMESADHSEIHTCPLIFEGTVEGFDSAAPTRSSSSWENGDKIYLIFSADNGETNGSAVYEDGAWTLSYYGSLPSGSVHTCSAVYFDSPERESGNMVSLKPDTGIYEDSAGTYTFNGESLTVSAALTPKTGRIRFEASEGETDVTLYGISRFSAYDVSTGKFISTDDAFNMKVVFTATPYIYGYFTDQKNPRINLITSKCGFTRYPSTSVYRKGESGYMSIPTENNYSAWEKGLTFNVGGENFTMVPVVYSSGNFFMAETETTQALYAAVTGAGESSQMPKSGLSTKEWDAFVVRLNTLTGLKFRVPTNSEWTYAANGGQFTPSPKFTYSGSNNIDLVAWYQDNSGGKAHPVKEKQPNQLGLYDMSGNLTEYTYYYSYYYCGGYYLSPASGCTSTSTTSYPDADYLGFRLALSNSSSLN